MRLYLSLKEMTFDEKENLIKHEIILRVSDIEFYGYDMMIELPDNDRFIKDTMEIIYKKNDKGEDIEEIDYKQFNIREKKTWWNFPLYELKDGKIIPFDYTKYDYFTNTDRRMALASKINDLYNPPSEAKILRKTFKYIMDNLNIEYPEFFKKYNDKIEAIIEKNLKN